MNLYHYIGMAVTVLFAVLLGIISGRNVKTAEAFVLNRGNAGMAVLVGGTTGAYIGGSATIGTAQLAFTNGFSAIWFTLGGTIGLFILALFFVKPLRNSGKNTMPEIITAEYGKKVGVTTAVLNSCGNFLGVVAQTISGTVLIMTITSMGRVPATAAILIIMFLYMVFGGVLSAGIVGYAKMLLLFAASIFWFCYLNTRYETLVEYWSMPVALPHGQYFSLVSRGLSTDLGAGFSVILGLMSTQAYMQAVISGKTAKVTSKSLIISGLIILATGIISVYIGMFMRVHYPETPSQMVLPIFILREMHPLLGGAMLGLLLISVIGSCASLALGISALIYNNVLKPARLARGISEDSILLTRLILVVVLILASVVCVGNFGQLILGWSFLSMALRGTVIFIPMCAALFLPGKIPSRFVQIATICGPVSVVLVKILSIPGIDGIFVGVVVSLLIIIIGFFSGKYRMQIISKER
ncbi:MAG: hypothetical protein II914_08665 [Clostridia bacterium]|nr:hypothetical protein [Clostridia bacterium]